MTALLLALLGGQPDTLLIEVLLTSNNERVLVTAVLEADSALYLPSEPLANLLGVRFPTPWLPAEQLRQQFPTLTVAWLPRELRVVIVDDLAVLPASRRARQQTQTRTRAAFSLPVRSGPFLSLAVDDSLRGVFDGGYYWRGKVSVGARFDNAGAALWNVTAAPSSHLFLSYGDSRVHPPNLSARVAAGPLWLAGSWTGASSRVDVAGLVRLGVVQVFASQQFAVLTFQPTGQLVVQAARSWTTNRTAARISVGPVPASPFSFPITTIP